MGRRAAPVVPKSAALAASMKGRSAFSRVTAVSSSFIHPSLSCQQITEPALTVVKTAWCAGEPARCHHRAGAIRLSISSGVGTYQAGPRE